MFGLEKNAVKYLGAVGMSGFSWEFLGVRLLGCLGFHGNSWGFRTCRYFPHCCIQQQCFLLWVGLTFPLHPPNQCKFSGENISFDLTSFSLCWLQTHKMVLIKPTPKYCHSHKKYCSRIGLNQPALYDLLICGLFFQNERLLVGYLLKQSMSASVNLRW
jgi:hypothetical protein